MTTRAFGELTFEADKGVHISDAALTAARIARDTGRELVMRFNGIAVRVAPGDAWDRVVNAYWCAETTREFSF